MGHSLRAAKCAVVGITTVLWLMLTLPTSAQSLGSGQYCRNTNGRLVCNPVIGSNGGRIYEQWENGRLLAPRDLRGIDPLPATRISSRGHSARTATSAASVSNQIEPDRGACLQRGPGVPVGFVLPHGAYGPHSARSRIRL